MIPTSQRYMRLGVAIVLLGTLPVARAAHGWISASPVTICPFRTLTTRPCALCGLTRAFAHAMHGEWSEAFGRHPLWWLAMLVVVGVGLVALYDAARPADLMRHVGRVWRRTGWYVVAAAFAFSIVRAVAG